ncbi:MAG: hypothetical protein IJU75_02175 [Clostridia bacterium]|nr:hypothetical protein [Clostridia bacterium]
MKKAAIIITLLALIVSVFASCQNAPAGPSDITSKPPVVTDVKTDPVPATSEEKTEPAPATSGIATESATEPTPETSEIVTDEITEPTPETSEIVTDEITEPAPATSELVTDETTEKVPEPPKDPFAGKELEVYREITPGTMSVSSFEMRGFTVSPDGKFAYCGFLQGGRLVVKYDVEHSFAEKESYKPESGDNELYCKGLAADDRGYVYVGITHNGESDISVAVLDGNMNQIGYRTDDLGVSKAGVNGVAVQKLGGKYLLFAVTGYDLDSVRCYDVTDPSNISLFDGFGEGGVMAWATAGGKEDPSYIAVDPDGVVYVSSEKDNAVYKISKDGKKSLGKASVTKAFGLCEYGDYIFAPTKNGGGSVVEVLKKSDLSKVSTLKYEDQKNNLSDAAVGGGKLFVGDHGDNVNASGIVLGVELG